MYEKDGEKYFVVDGHIHFWDGSPENWKNVHGQQFIECFHDYHKALSPEEYKWPIEEFYKYSEERILHDLFEVGYVDKAIFQPTYLTDFYKNGFNTTEQDGVLAEKYPERFIVNGSFDPRDGEAGLGSSSASRAVQPQGRQALHGRVEGALQGLEPQGRLGQALSGEVR